MMRSEVVFDIENVEISPDEFQHFGDAPGAGQDSNNAEPPKSKAKLKPTVAIGDLIRERPSHGSDVQIARCLSEDLFAIYGKTPYCDGEFWRWSKTHWAPIFYTDIHKLAQLYDGIKPFNGNPIRLSRDRISSILHELGVLLTERGFFEDAQVGINCASGFIKF